MNHEIWQQLLSLESTDLCKKWFKQIHGRELNARRAKEINSAAKQSREYFRNASTANYSVRPLFTFYGVSSLSRSLLLLLKRSGGEETLYNGHGLTAVNWNKQLSGEPSTGLKVLGELKIETCSGLFYDFITETKNKICIHYQSEAVDWRLNYKVPNRGDQFTLFELFARIPDLSKDYSNISTDIRYASINELSYTPENGFTAKVRATPFETFKLSYENIGYTVESQGQWCTLSCDSRTFSKNTPQFIHSYIQKTFGAIPNLHIADFLTGNTTYSQLSITYLVAYYLGMLVRYYPTHWMSLIQGGSGDEVLPTIYRAQQFVEDSYPELVIEMIYDILNDPKRNF